MSRARTLASMVARVQAGRASPAIWSLLGCPVGGWGEARQARERIVDVLPARSLRDYTIDDLIEALYEVDHGGRYRARDVS